jgi:hypothetical protein
MAYTMEDLYVLEEEEEERRKEEELFHCMFIIIRLSTF